MHHRDPGVIGTLGAQDESQRPFYGLIADGIHVHPNAVRIAYQCHPEGAVLVTDGELQRATLWRRADLGSSPTAMSLMDPRLPNGKHEWRDGRFIVKDGLKLYIDGTTTLAGSFVASPPLSSVGLADLNLALYSAISLDHCVRNLASFTSIPLSKAIQCATWNVAQMLGGEVARRKGALLEGRDADLVVLDQQGVVMSTWVMGKEVYSLA